MNAKLITTKFGNPVLRETASVLNTEDIISSDTQQLIQSMWILLNDKQYGIGLSAPQVGRSIALSVIEMKPTPTLPNLETKSLTLINPVITEIYGKKKNMWEGCVSAGEGENTICAKVPRPNKITLQWLDEKAVKHEADFEGFIAHTIQHEVDHLNGVLFVDRVEDTKTYMLVDEFKKFVSGE
jgi:peptide deformylase